MYRFVTKYLIKLSKHPLGIKVSTQPYYVDIEGKEYLKENPKNISTPLMIQSHNNLKRFGDLDK